MDCNKFNKIPWPLYALDVWMMIMDYYNIPLAINIILYQYNDCTLIIAQGYKVDTNISRLYEYEHHHWNEVPI